MFLFHFHSMQLLPFLCKSLPFPFPLPTPLPPPPPCPSALSFLEEPSIRVMNDGWNTCIYSSRTITPSFSFLIPSSLIPSFLYIPHSYPASLPPFSSSPPFPHPLSSLPLPSLFHPIALPIPSSPHLPSILSLPSSLHPSHPSHSSDIALSIQKPAGSIQRLKEGVENFSLGTNTWTNDIIFKPNCTYISLPFLPSLSHLHLTKITLYDEKQFQK